MSSVIWWGVVAVILLGIAVWTEYCVPTRGDEEAPAKIVGLVVVLGLVCWGWSYGELRWPILAALLTAGVWRRLRRGARFV